MNETLVVALVCVVAMGCVLGIAALSMWYNWGITRKMHGLSMRTLQSNLALSDRPGAQILAHKQEDTEQLRTRVEGEVPANGNGLSWQTPQQRERNFAGG